MNIFLYIILVLNLFIIFCGIMFIKKNFLYYDEIVNLGKKHIKFPRIMYIIYFICTIIPICNLIFLFVIYGIILFFSTLSSIKLTVKEDSKYKNIIYKIQEYLNKIETYLMKEF